MRHVRSAAEFVSQPAVQILAGLCLLLIVLVAPALTACTGMALVALGATAASVERLAASPARGPLLTAHLLIYTAIYVLFVGASLDAAARAGIPLSKFTILDLAVSLALVILAARIGMKGNSHAAEY